jgi:hypothetical protein
VSVTPYGFATVAQVLAHLKRTSPSAEDTRAATAALNWTAGQLERATGRRLCMRSYREPVVIACATTINTKTVTGSGFNALLQYDDVVGANLAVWSRVASVESDGSLTLTENATASGATTLTFGSERLVVDGHPGPPEWLSTYPEESQSRMVQIPEYPVLEMPTAMASVDDAGAETAISLVGARLDRDTGHLRLGQGCVPRGDGNILIQCRAGYAEPTGLVRGNPSEWYDLQHWTLRLCECFFKDQTNLLGRETTVSALGLNLTVQGWEIPADIEKGLSAYRRMW